MKKLAIIAVLWMPFSLGCVAAILVSLAAIVLEENEYAKDVLRAMDKTLAAVLGFSGFYTLSAECGATNEKPWALLRAVLDAIQPGHCTGAAINEGLIKQ